MANTVDTLGEQEILDGLVAHTLENYEDDRIKTVRTQGFYHNDTIKSISLPNAIDTGSGAFSNCSNLELVNIPNINSFQDSLFSYCHKLKTITSGNVTTIYNGSFSYCASLNSFDFSHVARLGNSSLSFSGFGTISLPNCTGIGTYIIVGSRISTIEFFKKITFPNNSFNNCYTLVHLLLKNDSLCPLNGTQAFDSTPIKKGVGWIYVPSDLVESYKTASNWSTYADQFVSLDEYPKALSGETITDSWDEIFQAEEDGSYKTKYSVGDTKYLVIGGTYILMQIIAFDKDILTSDETSTAKITWLSKGVPSFYIKLDEVADNSDGWEKSPVRTFLNNIIYNQIPENIKNKILAVNKTSRKKDASTVVLSDKLWIPSAREIFGEIDDVESSGITYADFFNTRDSRKKYLGAIVNIQDFATEWSLRSKDGRFGTQNYSTVTSSGDKSSKDANTYSYYPLGFCT